METCRARISLGGIASLIALALWLFVPVCFALERTLIAGGLTTNTTSAAVIGTSGPKSFYGQVVGTGAVTQTQAIYGDIDNDAANGILLCTITLSGTTRTQDVCPVVTANFSYLYVITTNTTGTGATGSVVATY
jgi:hypothetical protein